jgi:hypothetical protein
MFRSSSTRAIEAVMGRCAWLRLNEGAGTIACTGFAQPVVLRRKMDAEPKAWQKSMANSYGKRI